MIELFYYPVFPSGFRPNVARNAFICSISVAPPLGAFVGALDVFVACFSWNLEFFKPLTNILGLGTGEGERERRGGERETERDRHGDAERDTDGDRETDLETEAERETESRRADDVVAVLLALRLSSISSISASRGLRRGCSRPCCSRA